MEKFPARSSDTSCFMVLLQYCFMFLVLAIPVIWKLYISHPMIRYHLRMTFYIIMVLVASFMMIPLSLRDPFNPDNARAVGTRVFIRLLRVADLLGIRIIQRGLKNFDIDGPFIVVSNHQTSLDLLPMFATLPKRCTGMGKKELLFAGPFGLAALLCGGILVDRRPGKSREALAKAVENIKTNNVRLWIFAEGTRNHKDGFLPFKKGAFHLALQAEIPIIPVVISSYSSFYEKQEAKFEGGDLIVTVLPPVSSKPYSVESIDAFIETVRTKMLTVFKESSNEVESKAAKKPQFDG